MEAEHLAVSQWHAQQTPTLLSFCLAHSHQWRVVKEEVEYSGRLLVQ